MFYMNLKSDQVKLDQVRYNLFFLTTICQKTHNLNYYILKQYIEHSRKRTVTFKKIKFGNFSNANE